MATTEEIAWNDGSGDKIYVTSDAFGGDQTILVSSDANTGNARSKIITFTSGVGNITRQLTVSQESGIPQEYTLTVYPSSYVSADSSYYSLSNVSRAYDSATTTNYASIGVNRGYEAETYIYFKFNCSSIPANATILSVSCDVKTSTSGTAVRNANVCLYCGTSAKGSPASATGTTAQTNTLSGATWTLAELEDIRVRFWAKRGTTGTTSNATIYFYGATLTVTYTV